MNSSRYLLFEVYFSLHQRNNACKYKLQRKPIISSSNFRAVISNFSQFHEHIFLKVIKQPFHSGVKLNRFLKKGPCYYVLMFFFSTGFMYKKSNSFVYIFVVLSVFPNNFVRVCLIKLKIGMLYYMNNTFRNTVFRYLSV